MAKSTYCSEHLPVTPASQVDVGVVTELGVSVEHRLQGCARYLGGLGVENALHDTVVVAASAESVEGTFAFKNKATPLLGEADGTRAITYIGSVMRVVDSQIQAGRNDLSRDQLASLLASVNAAHELSHVADNILISPEKLAREDRLYERRRLARAVLPNVLRGMGMGLAVSFLEAEAIITEMPNWVKAVLAISGVAIIAQIGRDIFKSQLPMARYETRHGEKGYKNHPHEKRARRRAAQYRRDLLGGRAPSLVKVTTVSKPKSQ